MTRQTNIGLLLALIFIVAFSLVLTEFRQPAQDIEKQKVANVDVSYYQTTSPNVSPVRPVVRDSVREPVRPENRSVATGNQTPAPARETRITRVTPANRPDYSGTMRFPQNSTPPAYRERTIDEFAREVAQMPAAGNKSSERVYVVIRGDNLRKISKKVYNSDRQWRKIYEANRSKLSNPNDIQIGMKLVIPEV